MRLAQAVVALATLSGCEFPQGSQLYDVTATLNDSTCGTGVVDAEDSLSFEVQIERDDDSLMWDDSNNGAQLEGAIDDDDFVLATSSQFEVTASEGGAAGCSVVRRDRYEGTIEGSGDTIDRIEGEVTYTFSQATGYDCDDLIGVTNGFEDLPCTVTYTFVALPTD